MEAQGAALSDEQVVERVCAGERDLFEVLMRRYNQRLFRVARSSLPTDTEAEDVVQEAWVRAYTHLSQFERRSRFSTWLVRIALHEAWARARRARRFAALTPERDDEEAADMKETSKVPDPENATYAREMRGALERALETLPEAYRTVFVLREVEELSTAETADCLEVSQEVVKTRLHRARGLLRREILARAGASASGAFSFLGKRCDRMVATVFARIVPLCPSPGPAQPVH